MTVTGFRTPLPGSPIPTRTNPNEIDGIPINQIQQGTAPGLWTFVRPGDPRSGQDLLLLADGLGNTPRFVSVNNWTKGVFNLEPEQYERFKQSFGIKDDSKRVNSDFVLRAALPTAQAISFDNFNYTQLGKPSYSWEAGVLQQGYGRPSKERGPTTTRTTSVTSVDNAVAEFQNYSREYLGYELSKKEAREYQKKLNSLERKRFTTTTAGEGFTNVTQGGVGREEREQLALDIIGRRIKVEGIDDPGKVGGLIGNAVRNVRSLISNYGLSITPQEVRDYALQSLRSQTGLDTVETKFNNLARIQYQGLVPYLDQGLSVKDIAGSYMSKMAQMLELNPASITIDNNKIQKALTGEKLKPLYEFEMDLRKDPEWQFTNNAREEASQYAYTILRDFGLI
jgi:hypothetical protein